MSLAGRYADCELCNRYTDEEVEEKTKEIPELREKLKVAYIKLSGKKNHSSDCSVNNSPAETPGECDCDEKSEHTIYEDVDHFCSCNGLRDDAKSHLLSIIEAHLKCKCGKLATNHLCPLCMRHAIGDDCDW
jgi:hypothetical protein